MIPKTIHYCWFGGKPLPKSALKCIASWRKFFPDYEIKEWNENNFDVNMVPFTAEAYATKKYAFVSDFARFWILHREGGVYFDTDVEVIRPMDDILRKGAFLGMEARVHEQQPRLCVNPGLGCACSAGNEVWACVLEKYRGFHHFCPEEQETVCTITSDVLERLGASLNGGFARCQDVSIYPAEYFCPRAKMGAPIYITENTRSIHHFDGTWLPAHVRLKIKFLSLLPIWLQRFIRKIKR